MGGVGSVPGAEAPGYSNFGPFGAFLCAGRQEPARQKAKDIKDTKDFKDA
jgi:hypothetical protein